MRNFEYIYNRAIGIFLLIWLIFCELADMQAQSLSVSAPSHVKVGENFRVQYTINTQEVKDFQSGIHSTDEVEIIAGPYTSRQSSYQIINGHTASNSSVTYTYTLYANKNGTFTVPAAHAIAGGKKLSSNPVKINISGSSHNNQGSTPRMHEDDDNQAMRAAGSKITAADLFIKVSANKKQVHEQEPVLLTYKVYTLVDLTQLKGSMPDLKGFHSQEVPLPQQKRFHVENVNGRNYRCVTWSQYVMYPQMTGELEIPSITFKGTIVQQNRAVDPFEAFFNGGSGYVELQRDIVAPSIKIKVIPLPQRPAGFLGGVGKFNISAQLDKTTVKAGDPVTLRVIVGGIGNMKLLKEPVVDFPKDFDKYDAKVTDKTKLTANGAEGNMIYDFLFVPRNQGKYTIPAVSFIYYDPAANDYKTIKTSPIQLNVEKGNGNSSSIADYSAQKEKDIHPIKLGKDSHKASDSHFFGSTLYWVTLLLPLITFLLLLFIFRKRALSNADIVGKRRKKASQVATKRLRKARQLMQKGEKDEFYDETLRALWGYVGDKLNMPVEQLSRENIADKLTQHQVNQETINQFLTAIDECEMERYAPGDAAGNMNKTFSSAMTAIMEIEETMKKAGKKNHIATLLLLLICLPLSANAITKDTADNEYKKGNYIQAIKDYQDLIKIEPSAELYYNLGNAYFRTDNITQAVLAYERALQLDPGDSDIRFNLRFARSKTIDKIETPDEIFFVVWYHSLVNFMHADSWARLAILSIILALVLMLIYLFADRLLLRKIGFFGALIFFLLFLLGNFCAYQQKRNIGNTAAAIVMQPAAHVKKTPSTNSADAFIIHEGTKVNITDQTIKGWLGITLADGREGWVQISNVEKI